MDNGLLLALLAAVLIILPLAFYAGKLLYQLKEQTRRQQTARQERIENITESIQLIAKAVEQQQCNLSEGAIRLVRLLEGLPVSPALDCNNAYPALYELFTYVKDLPTHQERKQLDRKVRERQDAEREEHEVRLESKILVEVAKLKYFKV